VKAGELLIDLNPAISNADLEQARESLFVAAIDQARARALVQATEGGEINFAAPGGTPAALISMQKDLVVAKVTEHRSALKALVEERKQRTAEMAMVAAEVVKLEQQLPLAEDQLSSLETLARTGLVPRMRVAEVTERGVSMRQDLIIRRAELAKTRAALRAGENHLEKLKNEFRATALDALSEADANYRIRSEEIKKAEERLSLMKVQSPSNGVVAQLDVHTLGGFVQPGDPLMTIVPTDEEMMVEAMVLNKDIGFVRAGQSTEIKLEAFPFTRYGVVSGVIERISTDSIEQEEIGLVFPCIVKVPHTTPIKVLDSSYQKGKLRITYGAG
jgi:hemolysin D